MIHKRDKDNNFMPTGGNDIIPLSNSGCFSSNTRSIHCSICHKTVSQADATHNVAQPGPDSIIPIFHDDCSSLADYIIQNTPSQESKRANTKHRVEQKEYEFDYDKKENSFRFAHWDKGSYPPFSLMASAGFEYCENSKTIRCCCCNATACEWSIDTNPYDIHFEISPFMPLRSKR
ncbi:MAG: hypothetical protein KAG53_03725 [Endozoicomonadaceae bacterium]|nr:hypothetical protein [Endozoicomonadaceae bacterium]